MEKLLKDIFRERIENSYTLKQSIKDILEDYGQNVISEDFDKCAEEIRLCIIDFVKSKLYT